MRSITPFIASPRREYIIAALLVAGLLEYQLLKSGGIFLWAVALIGAIVPFEDAWKGIRQKKITIELFNFLALIVSFATGEIVSAAFIALMLTFASYLDWRTESRATNAVEELLKLKPNNASRERGEHIDIIPSEEVVVGDVLVVPTGERVPVDGVVIYGSAFFNESSLTGESRPVEKTIGDEVYSSTLSETGVIKMRATKVGVDSTIEQMAKLIAEAGKQKSKVERIADRFAGFFLPVVIVAGVATYLITGNIQMTIALFLVVCADDIAVSIPLAITASLGFAARRGVIIKGGEWIHILAGVKTLVFDKTGTLTYGHFNLERIALAQDVSPQKFWRMVGVAEKFSEHPVGRAIFKEAIKIEPNIPDPKEVRILKGAGIWVKTDDGEMLIGNDKMLTEEALTLSPVIQKEFDVARTNGNTVMIVFIDRSYAGMIAVADTPRAEARASILELKKLGVRSMMLTGDNESVAKEVSDKLGISEFRAGVTPLGKMNILAELSVKGGLAMVGDGINDAPALARADVGIAMGAGGTAVAVETANVVILTDDLARIPEMIKLAKRTVSVINLDIIIWAVTNALGVALVFTGVIGPALAAFYNFVTDFIPLLNSLRLFRHR